MLKYKKKKRGRKFKRDNSYKTFFISYLSHFNPSFTVKIKQNNINKTLNNILFSILCRFHPHSLIVRSTRTAKKNAKLLSVCRVFAVAGKTHSDHG